MNRYFDIYLNAGNSVPVVINANQYDASETWIFTLYTDDNQQYTPASGSIVGLKSDGNTIANAGTVNSDGQVVITETTQMTACAGINIFELILNGNHGTANFVVLVEPRPGDNATPSDSDLSLMQEAIEAASTVGTVGTLADEVTNLKSQMEVWLTEHAGMSNETILWEGTLTGTGSVTLSEDASQFDTIAVYTQATSFFEADTASEAHYYKASDLIANHAVVSVAVASTASSTDIQSAIITGIVGISGTQNKTFNLIDRKGLLWTGTATDDAGIIIGSSGSALITKVVGIKNEQTDAEVVAARVGSDGTQYNNLKARLDAENSDLKSALNAMFNGSVYDWSAIASSTYPTGFRTGRYDASSGAAVSSSTQIRSIRGISFENVTKFVIAPPNGYSVAVFEYDSSEEFIRSTGTVTGSTSDALEISVTAGHIYKFAFGKWTSITNDTITDTIVDAFVLTLYSPKIDQIEAEVTQLATAFESSKPFELSADQSTAIAENADLNTFLTAGTYKITNNETARTVTNIPTALASKIVVMELTQANRVFQLFIPLSTANVVYFRLYNGTAWTDWTNWAKADVVRELSANVSKRNNLKIQYESGSYNNGKATERLSIYIPAETGYILYRLYHFIDSSINCNTWRIYHAYRVDDNLQNQTDLTVTGEWECAIHLANRDDFSGGFTHGDEMMNNVTLLVDGVPTAFSSIASLTECHEVRMIRASKMYDPSDHSTAIADHGVEYVFNTDSLTINQSLKWLVAEELTNCFMAMFLPSKNHIDRAVINSDFEVLTLASSTSETTASTVKAGGSAVTMWDTDSGFSADVSVPVYPTGLTGGDSMSISDNSGESYNKVYFKVCGGGNSSVGELWKSKAIYRLKYKAV